MFNVMNKTRYVFFFLLKSHHLVILIALFKDVFPFKYKLLCFIGFIAIDQQ